MKSLNTSVLTMEGSYWGRKRRRGTERKGGPMKANYV